MARATFGGGASDFVMVVGAGGAIRVRSATLTLWTAKTGGTQLADLLLDGNPVTSIAVPSTGQVPQFEGPDDVLEMWASASGGARVLMTAVNYASSLDDDKMTTVGADAGSDFRGVLTATFTQQPTTDIGDWALLRRDTTDVSKGVAWTTPHAAVARVLGWLILTDPQFGVTLGASTDQTPAIKAALDANPGKTFYAPRGDYRLETTLLISANNSLVADRLARFYAAVAMDYLIKYDNGAPALANFSTDKEFVGGILDCALLANRGIYFNSFYRFRFEQTKILDPIYRGMVTGTLGAEMTCRSLVIQNTGTTNPGRTVSVTTNGTTAITGTGFVAGESGSPIYATGIPVGATFTVVDSTHATLSVAATGSATVTATLLTNVAIETNIGDCKFYDISPRDFTVGIWDKGGNRWFGCQPWLGVLAQLTARYPIGVAWILANNSVLVGCEADTYRYMFRTANPNGVGSGSGQTKTIELISPKAFVLTTNITDALAAANPGIIFDLQDGARVVVEGGRFQGHGVTPHAFTAGTTTRLTVRNPGDDVPGSVTSLFEYKRGVRLGTTSWSPTLYGHVAGLGNVTYTTRAGTMEVRDGMVAYEGRIVGTTGSDTSGNWRIGNFPIPVGATAVGLSKGGFQRRKGISTAFGAFGANGSSGTLVATVYDDQGVEIAAPVSTAFDIHFSATGPFTWPS